MNPFFDIVERLGTPAERYRAAHAMSAGGRSLLSSEIAARLQRAAERDSSPKLRDDAQRALSERRAGPAAQLT